MKKIYTIILLMSCLQSAFAQQNTSIDKYDIIPDDFLMVYHDMVTYNVTRTLTSGGGQYFGQISNEGQLYGYGVYTASNGNRCIGQYRNGECIFGIWMKSDSATVGSTEHGAHYDLQSGRLAYINKGQQKITPDPKYREYKFMALNYENGDRYVGEVIGNKRHGYGIYYWSNGNYWFGQYKNGVRDGFGALFTADGKLFIGRWNNENLQ